MKTKTVLGGLLASLMIVSGAAFAQGSVRVEVYKSAYCGCCGKWVEHLRKNGFDVVTKDVDDVPAARKALGMPDNTARVTRPRSDPTPSRGTSLRTTSDGFSPSPRRQSDWLRQACRRGRRMETSTPQPYETLLVGLDGSATVFARH